MADQYRVVRGLNYPPDRRAEPGDIVDDLPAKSVPWLLKDGDIEKVEPKAAKPKPKG